MAYHNPDRLYELLPQHIRVRDVEQGYPLRALLQVIARQVDVVQDDMEQLYDDWFIETCQEWLVPYIGELIGYTPIETVVSPGSRPPARDRIAIPRREVGHLIRNRARKGTLSVLETLAYDVTGWAAAAVEFYDKQPIDDELGKANADEVRLAVGNAAFDAAAGKLPAGETAVGLFVWRNHAYPVTLSTPNYVETQQAEFYSFSPLGNNSPLYTLPEAAAAPADRRRLPIAISRELFEANVASYYGPGKSLCIYSAEEWPPPPPGRGRQALPEPPFHWRPIPVEYILGDDLSELRRENRPNFPEAGDHQIVVDPVLGRFIFPGRPRQRPRYELRVSYQAGFHADLGGGEYQRPLSGHPQARLIQTECLGVKEALDEAIDLLANGEDHVIIEITDSGLYLGWLPDIVLDMGQSLQIRAANRSRPVIWIVERSTSLPDSMRVLAYPTSCFILDGVMLAGRGIHVDEPQDQIYVLEQQPARVIVRHSTLVPGWLLQPETEPVKSEAASIELNNVMTSLLIQRSIVGSISVAQEDAPKVDPSEITIEDSIVDSTAVEEPAIYGEATQPAYVALTVRRSTVLGEVEVRELPLVENSLLRDKLTVHNRQGGFVRYSSLAAGSRTPRYFRCRVEAAAPELVSVRFGAPGYCRLADTPANRAGAHPVLTGAEHGGEMGVYHHLFDPIRAALLQRRLEEYLPLGVTAQVFGVD